MQGFRVHSHSQGRMMVPQKTVAGGGCYPGPEPQDYNPVPVRKSPTPLTLGLSPKGTYRQPVFLSYCTVYTRDVEKMCTTVATGTANYGHFNAI